MSSVEAAASLFGSDETQSDPFSALGVESAQTTDDFFTEPGSNGLENTLDAGDHTAFSNAPNDTYSTTPNALSVAENTGAWGYGNSNVDQHSGYAQLGYGTYQPPTTTNYQPPAPNLGTGTTVNSYQPHTSTRSVSNDSSQQRAYSMYAPTTGAPMQTSYSQGTYAAPSMTSHTSYSPYAPSNQAQPSNTYAPPTPSYATNYQPPTVDPISPSASIFPPPPQPSFSSAYGNASSYGKTQNVVPAPPKQSAPLNRPKPNAYDPPFPTQSSRRSHRQVTPYAAEQPLYASQTPPPPVPPPPPRASQTPPVQLPNGYAPRPGSAKPHHERIASPPLSQHPPPPRTSGEIPPQNGRYSPAYQGAQSHSAYAPPVLRSNSSHPYDRYTPSPLSASHTISNPSLAQYSRPVDHHPPENINDSQVHTNESTEAESIEQTVSSPDTTIRGIDLAGIGFSDSNGLHNDTADDFDVEGAPFTTSISDNSIVESTSVESVAGSVASQPHSSVNHVSNSPPTSRYSPVIDRVSSPSGRSVTSTNSYSATARDTHSPSPKEAFVNGYDPPTERTSSPTSALNRPNGLPFQPPPPAGPPRPVLDARNRSMSNSSVASVTSASSVSDPYAPSKHIRRQASEVSDYGDYSSRFGHPSMQQSQLSNQSPYAPPQPSHPASQSPYVPSAASAYSPPQSYLPTPSQAPRPYQPPQTSYTGVRPALSKPTAPTSAFGHDSSYVQELSVPMSTQYAPSPSLLGSNDPLGRTAARIPVFSFGLGGKLVTCFHGASSLDTGFDIALTSRKSTAISIRALDKVVPESALSSTSAVFPGPLFADPGTPTSLVRTGLSSQSTQTKAKKARVLKYLGEREEEIATGIPYLHAGSVEQGMTEGKIALVRMLKVMVEHDGRLSGTPEIDAAVRAILVPRIKETSTNGTIGSFTSVADLQGLGSGFSGPTAALSLDEGVLATSVVRSSALDKIKEFLVRGERRQAYHYALDEKMWGHAMIIASSIDKDAWKEAVSEFLKTELGPKEEGFRTHGLLPPGKSDHPTPNGREGLRTAYSLYSGCGGSAVHELMPQNLLSKATHQPVGMNHLTPGTPNFPTLASSSVPLPTLLNWAETAAMIYSSPLGLEASAALTSLGDILSANGWTEAAHTCYLLAPQTSPFSGIANPASKLILVGSPNPLTHPTFHTDQDSLIFSEIAEFALSLTPPAKGHEPFNGLPHLQPYRLLRACYLAEIGQIQLSKRYCEAIAASSSRASPYFNLVFLGQLKVLTDRIIAAPQLDKGSSWIPGRMSKPSLDTIGGWLEGRITKLIAGDGEEATADGTDGKTEKAFDGPFAHYSTISSTAPSTSPSPQPSLSELQSIQPPPRRNGSVSSYQPSLNLNPPPPTGRSSSAMDFAGRRASPGPRIASAGPGTTTFSQSSSFGQAMDGLGRSYPFSPIEEMLTPKPPTEGDSSDDNGQGQEASWWGQSSYADGNFQTPTATTFMRVDNDTVSTDSEGFISLMDGAPSFSNASSTSTSRSQTSVEQDADDPEDLGFGNSKSKPKAFETEAKDEVKTDKASPKTEPAKAAQRPDPNANASGSWFGRWWKKSDGPVRANLGEERSIYYDPDLKRWVNKNAGADAAKPAAPPPPPSRAQTASPGGQHNMPPRSSPPARAVSAIDLGTSPPRQNKTVMRVRSNLVPSPESDSAPSTPTGLNSSLGPPKPPDRPRSQAAKRNIRSRYVDVFQENK